MIKGIKESKTLTRLISCKCNCKFDGMKCNQINGGIMINVNISVKNIIYVKNIVQNPNTCICENGKYLASIMGDSNKYLEETSFYERNIISFTKFLYSACLFLNYHCIIDSC